MEFNEAFIKLIGHEGNYSDHPADKGGPTCWGITEAVARENAYFGDMRELSHFVAKAIYRKKYWDACHLDAMPPQIRFAVFDAAVNSGVSQSVKWLQKACGVEADGIIGPQTMHAVGQLPPDTLARWIAGQRLQFMTDLPTWGTFGKGWARRIASNLMEA